MKNKFFLLSLFAFSFTTIFAQNTNSKTENEPVEELPVVLSSLEKKKELGQFDGARTEYFPLVKTKFVSVKPSSGESNKKYPATNVLDDLNSTAWVANTQYLDDPQPSAVGSVLYFNFSNNYSPIYIEIVPGYLKSDVSWEENGRVKKIRISYLRGEPDEYSPSPYIVDVVVELKLINGKLPKQSQFINLMSFHQFNMGFTDFDGIKIEILEVEKGSKYQDICISTINFYRLEHE